MMDNRITNRLLFSCAFAVAALVAAAGGRGDVYFVDGYHGGIYGHYPVSWKTQFIVDQLRSHPDWRIGLEIEPETWDTVAVRTPGAYEAFAQLLREGRMEYTNPTYAQPYCYNISGESLIRQFRYGIEKLRAHFPEITFDTYAVEEPCYTTCLPAVLKGFGFKYATLKCPNTCWGGYMAPYGGQLVNWIGPDGTEMLTVPRYGCEALEKHSVWQTTAWGNSPNYLKACRDAGIENPVGMCYQDAGWRNGPWLKDNRSHSQYVLWTEYIENHTPRTTSDSHRFTQDDIRVNLMWGSQVMQRIARQVREAENAMVMAEKIGAIARFAGGAATAPDQAKMDEAWRQLMLAQHHDSWIVPYNRLWHFGTWADAIELWTGFASRTAHSEMQRIATAVAPGKRAMVKVFNTTAIPREEVVEVGLPAELFDGGRSVQLTDSRGKHVAAFVLGQAGGEKVRKVIFKATVPPMGYATYSISRISVDEQIGKETASATLRGANPMPAVLENNKVRLEFDLAKGGTVKSLFLKSNGGGREMAPADTCTFALGELRGFFYDEGRFRSSAETAARVVAHECTPLRQSLTIEGSIAGHPFTQTYTLNAGSPRVDCSLRIDWQGNPGIGEYRERHWNHDRRGFCDDRYKLCLLLPTSFDADRLWKDAPFDVCESNQESTFFNRWSEIKHNVILNWIDVADKSGSLGLGLLSDHTTSYVHGPGFPTALTLQYSGQGLWGPNYRIDRPTEVNYALLPHAAVCGADAMADEADRFNEPLQAMLCAGSGKAECKSLLELDASGYRVSAAQCTPEGNLSIRLHNSHADGSASVKFNIGGARVSETDLMGNRVADVDAASGKNATTMAVGMPRNGFRTWEVGGIR